MAVSRADWDAGRIPRRHPQFRRLSQAWGPPGQGGGGSNLGSIIKQMQASQAKANAANEARFKEAMGEFENLGKAGTARIEQQTAQRQAQATQNLTSRGLGSTTITSAVSRGIASDAELQQQQLQESVSVQKAGLLERRTDAGPDLGLFANLLQMAGQGQAQQSQAVIRRVAPRPPGFLTRQRANNPLFNK